MRYASLSGIKRSLEIMVEYKNLGVDPEAGIRLFREKSGSVAGVVRSFPAGCSKEMSYDVGGGYKLLIINIKI